MKILVLSTWFPYPPDNGSKLRAYHLVKALAQHHDVTVAAFCWDGELSVSKRTTQLPGVELYAVEANPFRYVNMPTILRYASPLPLVYWPSQAMRQTLNNLRRLERWDVIVAIQTPVAQYALSWSIPRILDMDTALSYQMHSRLLNETRLLARLRAFVSWQKEYRYEAFLVRRFRTVTVVSTHEVDFLRSMARRSSCQVEVITNGVDTTYNHLDLVQPIAHSLVYNGALGYSVNYDAMQYFLAEVYPLIKQQVPNATLSITGSTRDVDMSGLKLDRSVRLTGYVEDIRLPVAHSAVCVVPLRQGGGTRIKILEAMALGTPVVATSKGAEGLNVINNKHLLLGDTPKAFADAVLHVMTDIDLRERLRRNARALIEQHYDWGAIGARFVALVEDAAKSNG